MEKTYQRDAINNPHLRFAVMCDSKILQSWQVECIKQILSVGNTSLELVIYNAQKKTLSNFDKIKLLFSRQSFFIIFRMFFCKSPVEKNIDITELISGIPHLYCSVKENGPSQYFQDSDIQTIKSYNLDFIIRFGFGFIKGEVLNTAKFGVWSFHHDDENKYRGCPPCFWEIYTGDNITGAILQRLTDRLDGGIILRKGFLKTVAYSYGKNLNLVYSESAKWPALVCKDILNGVADYFDIPPSKTKAKLYRNPNNFQMSAFIVKILKNNFLKIYKELFKHDYWSIGIVNCPIDNFLNSNGTKDIHWLTSFGKDSFHADPFGIKKDGAIYVFCEKYDYRKRKGNIYSMEVRNDSVINSQTSIDLNYHVSYPFLLENNGEYYCIIESSENKSIDLYKSIKFPYQWQKYITLVHDFAGVDASIFKFENSWWLSCTDLGPNHNLYLWHATNIDGPWMPHCANPVKTDIRSSRPAGTPFFYNNRLFRPAQDCSVTYGGKIIINEIKKLTPYEFKESPVVSVNPYRNSPYPSGIHTISPLGNLTLIDGKRFIFDRYEFIFRINNYISKLLFR